MKLSIIVPCYNVAPYLDRGLHSLVNQSLTDIEIICINDASTDQTGQLLQKWAQSDLRIRVIENKKNMGAGLSRNIGIESATGDYIGFMDPDDYCDPDFYSRLVARADLTGEQVVCGPLCVIKIDGTRLKDPHHILQNLRKSHHYFRYHYTAIYRRDFLLSANIRYPDLIINEDSVFETLVKCAMTTPMGAVRGVYYYYCHREGSLTADYWNPKKVADSTHGIETIVDIYNSCRVNVRDYIVGAHGYFDYLQGMTFASNRTPAVRLKVAKGMCRIFGKIQYKEVIRQKNYSLYLALLHNDPDGVIEVLNANQVAHQKYKLFGCIPFLTLSYNAIRKDWRLFGILICRKTII